MQPDDTKARLEIEGRSELVCRFNPSEIKISKQNNWSAPDAKGVNAPRLKFDTGRSGTLKTTLVFDTTHLDDEPVTTFTNELLKAMKIDKNLSGGDSGKNKGRPPWVRLHWGRLQSFKAVIEQLSINFTYFAQDGTPLRAKCDLSLKQLEDEEDTLPLQNPTSHTPYPHTVHRVQPGETLDRIAAVHYGDSSRWRLIARTNGVLDPLLVEVGTSLTIPEQAGVRRA